MAVSCLHFTKIQPTNISWPWRQGFKMGIDPHLLVDDCRCLIYELGCINRHSPWYMPMLCGDSTNIAMLQLRLCKTVTTTTTSPSFSGKYVWCFPVNNNNNKKTCPLSIEGCPSTSLTGISPWVELPFVRSHSSCEIPCVSIDLNQVRSFRTIRQESIPTLTA